MRHLQILLLSIFFLVCSCHREIPVIYPIDTEDEEKQTRIEYPWLTRECLDTRFVRITPGMSVAQVISILGPPTRGAECTIWMYDDPYGTFLVNRDDKYFFTTVSEHSAYCLIERYTGPTGSEDFRHCSKRKGPGLAFRYNIPISNFETFVADLFFFDSKLIRKNKYYSN